jgi:hypothetical protein
MPTLSPIYNKIDSLVWEPFLVHLIYCKRRFPPRSGLLFIDSLSLSRRGFTSFYSYVICGVWFITSLNSNN